MKQDCAKGNGSQHCLSLQSILCHCPSHCQHHYCIAITITTFPFPLPLRHSYCHCHCYYNTAPSNSVAFTRLPMCLHCHSCLDIAAILQLHNCHCFCHYHCHYRIEKAITTLPFPLPLAHSCCKSLSITCSGHYETRNAVAIAPATCLLLLPLPFPSHHSRFQCNYCH